MNEYGQALVESCDPSVADNIALQLSQINEAAQAVFKRCEAHGKRVDFYKGIQKLNDWLADTEQELVKPFTLKYNTVKDRLHCLEVINLSVKLMQEM